MMMIKPPSGGEGRRFSWICCIFMAGRLKQPFPGAARAGATGVELGAHIEVGRSALASQAPLVSG